MANKKITELDALTDADVQDVLAIVDDPSGTPVTKKITVGDLFMDQLYYGVSWDESKSVGGYTRRGTLAGFPTGYSPSEVLIPIQTGMRRCVMNDSGVVQYYLDPSDSTKKTGGAVASVLTGGDGQVMVEIPKFYHRYSYSGTTHTHDISLYQLTGFTVHNMFVKNGVEVDYRYIGAYEGALYDTSELKYVNGLYLPSSASYKLSFLDNGGADDTITSDSNSHAFSGLEAGVDKIVVSGTTGAVNDGTYAIKSVTDTVITLQSGLLSGTQANDECILQVERDWTASTGDVLGSVSGKAPMNYGTRAEFRVAASNRGTGWRQQDFDLVSGIQLLYLVEYGDWNSQSMIGDGLTDWAAAWPAWSNTNPIEKAGNSNSDGNASANTSGGDGAVGSYMSYRGIENFFGHLWKWVDGCNINGNVPYVCNTDTDFADDTATNYTALGVTLAAANNYVVTLEQIERGFLAASVGGSSSTYITDYYYQYPGWRVAMLGAGANDALLAGVAYWNFHDSPINRSRTCAGRLAY
jgi:hypothetical protein